jgi:hypothetical protein
MKSGTKVEGKNIKNEVQFFFNLFFFFLRFRAYLSSAIINHYAKENGGKR